MDGYFQKLYEHSLEKETCLDDRDSSKQQPRINLTFRNVLPNLKKKKKKMKKTIPPPRRHDHH